MTTPRNAVGSTLRSGILVFLVAACSTAGSPGATSPKGGSTGSLAITMTTPAGVTGAATVLGPAGYAHTVTGTQTLTGLAPGTYTVVGAAGTTTAPIVGVPYAPTVTGSPATVTANATANAAISYAQRATEGMLWIGGTIGYSASQLASSGSPAPAVHLTVNSTSMVVDATGGMWVGYFEGDTVSYYTQAQLLAGGSPTATIKIRPDANGSLSQVAGLALDARGDLWVANKASGTIVEFTPDQLTASGAPTPRVVLYSLFGAIVAPYAMSFDAKGDLWVASALDSTVSGYSPSQLATGGHIAPFAGLALSGSLNAPFGLAFDAAGDLWIASLAGPLAEFTPDELTSLGAPTPVVVITTPSHSTPTAIAFDESGGLWVCNLSGGTLFRYSASQLTASGSPTPATTITGLTNNVLAAVFSPHSNALPLH